MESDPELTYPSNHTGEKPAKHESTQLLYAALFSTPDFRNTEAESVWSSYTFWILYPHISLEKRSSNDYAILSTFDRITGISFLATAAQHMLS
jgi:hypothetical protein